MFVRRFYDESLAQAAYLIGCQRTGEAIVIDPPRDVAPLIAGAKAEGLRITRVTETHIHADFLSGSRELATATGADLLLSGEGGDAWRYRLVADGLAKALHHGDEIVMGGVRLTVRHTPGHTPEHLAFIVTDTARSEDPVAMVSGDFLFVGDVGRPDLLERAAHIEGTMEASARQLFQSIAALRDLPDYLQIWPGHGAGSACGKALGAMASSTLGYERRTNWALADQDDATFIKAVLEGQPAPPVYFAMMKRFNKEGPVVLGARAPLPLLPTAKARSTGMMIDVRPAKHFGARHLRGTLHLPLIKAFPTWAGWLVPYDQPIAVVAEDATTAEDARRRLASIGLDDVSGYFDAATLLEATPPDQIATSQLGDILDVAAYLDAGRTVIDIRNDGEWTAGHIPGAVHQMLGTLPQGVAAMDRDTPIAVHCQGGTRSAIGASVLEALGFTDIVDLSGGYSKWILESRE